MRCQAVLYTLHVGFISWRIGRRAHRTAAGNHGRCGPASCRRGEYSQPAVVAAGPSGNAAGDFSPARRNAPGSGGANAPGVPSLAEVASDCRDRCNWHGGCGQASGFRRDSRPVETFTEPRSLDPSGRRRGVQRRELGSPGKSLYRNDGVLVMEPQLGQRLELLDSQERALGQITLEERQGDLLLGSLRQGRIMRSWSRSSAASKRPSTPRPLPPPIDARRRLTPSVCMCVNPAAWGKWT